MKTTLDLPDELLSRLRARAERDGREVQEVAVRLLATALRDPEDDAGTGVPLPRHLPLIPARPIGEAFAAGFSPQQMSDFVKDIEQENEVERLEAPLGHQHVDRAHS